MKYSEGGSGNRFEQESLPSFSHKLAAAIGNPNVSAESIISLIKNNDTGNCWFTFPNDLENILGQYGLLACSIKCRRYDVVEGLIKRNLVNINDINNYGSTPLMFAIQCKDMGMVKILIDAGADINIVNSRGWNAIYVAAQNGDLDIFKYLVKAGCDINATTHSIKRSVRHIAYLSSHENICNYIDSLNGNSKSGTDFSKLESKSSEMSSHIEIAHLISTNRPENVNLRTLAPTVKKIDINTRINIQGPYYGRTLISIAAEHNHLVLLQGLLLFCGGIIDIKDASGNTPIMSAAKAGNYDIVRYLSEKGADINAKNNSGKSALMLAAKRGDKFMLDLLCILGSDINQKDKNGNTAIDIALKSGHHKLALHLESISAYNMKNKIKPDRIGIPKDTEYESPQKVFKDSSQYLDS